MDWIILSYIIKFIYDWICNQFIVNCFLQIRFQNNILTIFTSGEFEVFSILIIMEMSRIWNILISNHNGIMMKSH